MWATFFGWPHAFLISDVRECSLEGVITNDVGLEKVSNHSESLDSPMSVKDRFVNPRYPRSVSRTLMVTVNHIHKVTSAYRISYI